MGDHRADSDYDLLILVKPDFTFKDTDALYTIVMDILISTGNIVSLKIFKIKEYNKLLRMKTPFIQNISKEAILLGKE